MEERAGNYPGQALSPFWVQMMWGKGAPAGELSHPAVDSRGVPSPACPISERKPSQRPSFHTVYFSILLPAQSLPAGPQAPLQEK